MARYIDADNFRKTMIKRFGCIPCLTDYSEASRYDIPVDDALNLEPTADVVPKSEYDAVVSAVDNSTNEFLKLHDKYQEAKREVDRLKFNLKAVIDEIPETKSEVAREIFEEIEFDIHQLMFERDETRAIAIEGVIAELKKKYSG